MTNTPTALTDKELGDQLLDLARKFADSDATTVEQDQTMFEAARRLRGDPPATLTSDLAKKYVTGPTTPEEAEQFLRDCLTTLGDGFHPDDPMSQYALIADPEQRLGFDVALVPVFSAEDGRVLDRAMERVFDLLHDPYETTNRIAAAMRRGDA